MVKNKIAIVGAGTVLDSARLRTFLSRRCNINPQNVHGYVIGEHGDTSFPAWSNVTFGGVRASDFCEICAGGCSDEELRDEAAQQIIQAKGSTFYAVAREFDGFRETAFSYPRFIGKEGIAQELKYELTGEETELLHQSVRYSIENIERAGY